ncbi:MAG: hypothetical protein A07HR67_01287, partial [uncultured archaeon A07HR67]
MKRAVHAVGAVALVGAGIAMLLAAVAGAAAGLDARTLPAGGIVLAAVA